MAERVALSSLNIIATSQLYIDTCHVHNFNPPSSVHFPIPINPPPRLFVISNTHIENASQSSTICIYQTFQREKSLQGVQPSWREERSSFPLQILQSFWRGKYSSFSLQRLQPIWREERYSYSLQTSANLERGTFLVFFAKISAVLERGRFLVFFAKMSAVLERGTFLVFFAMIPSILERGTFLVFICKKFNHPWERDFLLFLFFIFCKYFSHSVQRNVQLMS